MSTLQEMIQNAKNEILNEFGSHKDQIQGAVETTKQEAATIAGEAKQAVASLEQRVAELEAFIGKTAASAPAAPTQPTSANDIVANAVPGASPEQIHAAILAHDEAKASGSDHDAAAVHAAMNSGAAPDMAQAIAAAIPVLQ